MSIQRAYRQTSQFSFRLLRPSKPVSLSRDPQFRCLGLLQNLSSEARTSNSRSQLQAAIRQRPSLVRPILANPLKARRESLFLLHTSPSARHPAQFAFRTMSTTTTTTAHVESVPPTNEITAENILRLFPEIDTGLATQNASGNELEGYDEEQIRLMDEVCIVLDNDDKPIGSATKKICECASLCG